MSSSPACLTDTAGVLAVAVLAAVQPTLLDAAVSPRPSVVTPAGLSGGVQPAVPATPRDALPGCRIQVAAVCPQPTLLTEADTRDAVAVAGAVRVRAVRLLAELPLVALHADTLPVLAVSVSAAVRHLALLVADIALFPLPAWLAYTLPAAVFSLPAAEQRTDALTAGLPVIPCVTAALTLQTISSPTAAIRAPRGQLLSTLSQQLHGMGGPVIIVKRHEPVASFQEYILHTLDRTLELHKL